MARRRGGKRSVQAWVDLRADDPEALSALAVARADLAAGRELEGLRRLRVFELSGKLPDRESLADLLHRSIQFYNPAKERCTVREADDAWTPGGPKDWIAVVWDRGGERRAAAERWWLHETGERIEVREGVAWVMGFARGGSREGAADLAETRDHAHGLLCNPNAQDWLIERGVPPLPIWSAERRRPTAAAEAP